MMAKPIRVLELHYPMIQFLIMLVTAHEDSVIQHFDYRISHQVVENYFAYHH